MDIKDTERIFMENEDLKKEIEKLKEINEDYLSYKIFTNARKKFVSWMSVAVVIFTAFGLISINSLVTTIKGKIEENGTEKIISDIKKGFIEKHQATVISEVIESINPFIKARIDEMMRKEMTLRLQQAEENTENDTLIRSFSKAFRDTYKNEKYIVIAGSSPRQKDLENLLQEIESSTGNNPRDIFPNLYIRKSKNNSDYYMLILEENISFSEAQKVRNKAINYGFRSDTFFRNTNES